MIQYGHQLHDDSVDTLGWDDSPRDLDKLQYLIDTKLVTRDMREELYAIGIVLGQIIAVRLNDYRWVVVTHNCGYGSSTYGGMDYGLISPDGSTLIYPGLEVLTPMLQGEDVSLRGIYEYYTDDVEGGDTVRLL